MATATVILVLASTLILLQNTYATTTYTVGDLFGWQIPTINPNLYGDWADNETFVVGDVLVFNFTTGQHDVLELTEPGYDACTTSDTILTVNKGPARVTLASTGEHYFICAYLGHCSAGQKLKVDVRDGRSNTPAGVLSPPGAASSLVATMSLVFMIMAFALMS
ncbi:putative Early nodulin 16 [Hibiscus syriacus]|uniref:Early nodulin 16 n=1 Tax=Hibiscus syriacus TaxID=106335 RepID=A0A6A2XHG3_HIBSY|nr:stellacyanin-like [Hibiscus syriacus]KAE8657879.1 putative Early nodulin 16 [Hibiscus syriacus]